MRRTLPPSERLKLIAGTRERPLGAPTAVYRCPDCQQDVQVVGSQWGLTPGQSRRCGLCNDAKFFGSPPGRVAVVEKGRAA